jgi:hypothetical protein
MAEEIREIIRRELPRLITEDPELHNWVWNIVHEHSLSRAETESRFEKVLAEIRRVQENSERRWEANERRWEANERRWEANERRWEANERRWEENQRQIRALMEEIQRQGKEIQRVDRRVEQTVGALGARWGIMSEDAFRNALRGILEENFGVKVERVQYKDESGEVFGRPDQVELDVVIYNGQDAGV